MKNNFCSFPLTRRNTKTMSKLVSGFTLVEVIVVIGIIAILTTIAYASLTQIRAKSRDQKRVADVHEIQLALEYFYNKNGKYPEKIWPVGSENASSTLVGYLSAEPKAPTSGEIYNYFSIKTTSARCVSYHLWTKLELKTAALDSRKGYDSTTQTSCLTSPVGLSVNAASDPLIYDLRP